MVPAAETERNIARPPGKYLLTDTVHVLQDFEREGGLPRFEYSIFVLHRESGFNRDPTVRHTVDQVDRRVRTKFGNFQRL